MQTAGPVVTLGETLVILAAAPGRLAMTRTLTKSVGGAESNVAIGLARLGLPVEAITRVGADPFGEEIIRTLRAEAVGVGGIEVDPGRPTAMMIKERPTAERANVFYYRAGSAAAALDADSVQRAWDGLGATPRHVHLSGVTLALGDGPRAGAARLLQLAEAVGATVSFDANHRRRLWDVAEFRSTSLPVAVAVQDLLVSDDEALALTGRSAPQPGADPEAVFEQLVEALLELAAAGPARVVLRRGADGSLGAVRPAPGRPAMARAAVEQAAAVTAGPVVDVVGAGDAYTAGYLVEILGGADLPTAMATGSWVAGHVVASLGDWEGLPDAADLAQHRSGVRALDR